MQLKNLGLLLLYFSSERKKNRNNFLIKNMSLYLAMNVNELNDQPTVCAYLDCSLRATISCLPLQLRQGNGSILHCQTQGQVLGCSLTCWHLQSMIPRLWVPQGCCWFSSRQCLSPHHCGPLGHHGWHGSAWRYSRCCSGTLSPRHVHGRPTHNAVGQPLWSLPVSLWSLLHLPHSRDSLLRPHEQLSSCPLGPA